MFDYIFRYFIARTLYDEARRDLRRSSRETLTVWMLVIGAVVMFALGLGFIMMLIAVLL